MVTHSVALLDDAHGYTSVRQCDIDFDAVVKARTGRNKVALQVLWDR